MPIQRWANGMGFRATWISTAILLSFSATLVKSGPALAKPEELRVPILVYHRFDAQTPGPMTLTTAVFESQLQILCAKGYQVIPLRALVNYLLGQGPAPAPGSVVITADDGHKSVYSLMRPLVEKFRAPVTLFIYPSAISNASYALNWPQLQELKNTGLFDIQSHTYWHPNFNTERKRHSPSAYEQFVIFQLTQSKAALESRLGGRVDLLAWPFGICDNDLMRMAATSGYIAGFTIERRPVRQSDPILALRVF
jgi:peptidoglycan/xylan/chitin deacetylase (PgdA/CDA1 family)